MAEETLLCNSPVGGNRLGMSGGMSFAVCDRVSVWLQGKSCWSGPSIC